MRVQRILTYPDGSRLTVQSPNVVGETDMARLARILEGETARKVYGNKLRLPRGFGPETRGAFVAIAIDDAPLYERWHSTRVFVTDWPLPAQTVAGIVLQRDGGEWVAYPAIYDDLTASEAPALLVREPWVILLATISTMELAPYLAMAGPLDQVIGARIIREVQSRCNVYNQRELVGFFRDQLNSHLWQIGMNWARWDDDGYSFEDRLRELVEFDETVEMNVGNFVRLCQEHGLAIGTPRKNRRNPSQSIPVRIAPVELFTLLRGDPASTIRHLSEFRDDEELKTIFTSGSYGAVGSDSSLSAKEFALVRDWSPEADAVFSYGGNPDTHFDTDPELWATFPLARQRVTLDDLLNHVWWWKSYVEDFVPATQSIVEGKSERDAVDSTAISSWSGELMDLFRDNWEWSAFLYEFRARYGGRYSWEPFGKPWPKLNHTERGILACVWPPKHTGSHRIQPKLSPVVLEKMKSIEVVKLQHDLHAPGAIAEGMVLTEIVRFADAFGFSLPGRGEGKRQKVPWRAIQLLDLQYLLGRKFPGNESKLKQAIANYEAAFKEVNRIP